MKENIELKIMGRVLTKNTQMAITYVTTLSHPGA